MSLTDSLTHPDDVERRRVDRLSSVASDLAGGTTDVRDLKSRLADGLEVAPAANLVRASADPIGHANVSAAHALGFIVPGP